MSVWGNIWWLFLLRMWKTVINGPSDVYGPILIPQEEACGMSWLVFVAYGAFLGVLG